MHTLLDELKDPLELRNLSVAQLYELAEVLRERIIEVTSKTGGHLASSLGTVELTLALCHFFDFNQDKIVWDVGHQGYAYKLLTGRNALFDTIGQKEGLSKFLLRSESSYDHFGAGHASTSISSALGIEVGLHSQNIFGHRTIAVIGDGSMTGGLSFEAMNHAGHLGNDLIIILNDNNMSIGPNVGGFAKTIINIQSSKSVNWMRDEILALEKGGKIPNSIANTMKKLNESFMAFFTPGVWFEKLNIRYFGPVDGHKVEDLISLFNQTKNLKGPILLHVLTQKGKGYPFAEIEPVSFHGVNPFEPSSGKMHKQKKIGPSCTAVWSHTFEKVMDEDEKVVAVSAAMLNNTGLATVKEKYRTRVFDVGIAEGHAVTFSGGMATTGLKPFVVIYSTFLQRAIDNIIHDIALQNLPVRFIIDRGGLVGADGATHHGVFDLTYMRMIPNMVVMVPKNGYELIQMIKTAHIYNDGPISLRFPRNNTSLDPDEIAYEQVESLPIGKGELLRSGKDILLIAVGTMVNIALNAAERLEEENIQCSVINARFVKPLDQELFFAEMHKVKGVITLEENVVSGGMGSAISEWLHDENIFIPVKQIGIPDRFIHQGTQKNQYLDCGLDIESVIEKIRNFQTLLNRELISEQPN